MLESGFVPNLKPPDPNLPPLSSLHKQLLTSFNFCSLGVDSLPLMRAEVDQYVKEMKDWEEDTLKVLPSAATEGRVPLDG